MEFALRRPRLVLAVTAIVAVVAVLVGGPVAGLLKTGRDNFEDRGSESAEARAALVAATGRSPEADLVVLVRGAGLDAAGRRGRVRAAQAALSRSPEVARTLSALDRGGAGLRSPTSADSLVVGFLRAMDTQKAQEASLRIADRVGALDGVTVGGPVLATAQIRDQVTEDLRRAELLAFPLLFVLSLFIFRGLVAALMPVLIGALAVLGALLALRLAVAFTDLSIFALNLVTALGLGLAIDYSLFVLSRFREEALVDGHGAPALRRTLATAGHTVLFSSLTVALALSALLVFPQRFLTSMAIGGALVALVAGFVALVVLPAVLLLLGDRVDALSVRPRRTTGGGPTGWARLTRRVTRRPGLAAGAATLGLLVVALPAGGVQFTGFDATILPTSASARQVADNVARGFPADRTAPLIVAVAGGDQDEAAEVGRRWTAIAGASAVGAPRVVGDGLVRFDVFSREGPLRPATQQLVDRTRTALDGLPARVTGEAARFRDSQQALTSRGPLALALLAVTTFLLLGLMTRSVVLPLGALGLNLATVAASFGLLVLVFQDGRLEGLLAYTSQGALDASQMVLLFVLVFALSTDYGVFVLGRIKEARDAGRPGRESIIEGVDATGPLVTSAAALFCVAMGAFATSQIVFIKEVGIGTALAVLIDATIIRAVLLPALLSLLGDRAWWRPRVRRGPAAVGTPVRAAR